MNLAASHLKRNPKARPTTISDRMKVQRNVEILRAEIAALHRSPESRPEPGLLGKMLAWCALVWRR